MKNINNIDFNFIHELEGFSLEGYVPLPKTSQSGVTIASGFDIGQCSVEQLNYHFSSGLSKKLAPYAGKKRVEAMDFLQKNPLLISTLEASEINRYTSVEALVKITTEWNKSNSKKKFEQLPKSCATVVASVAFQYGCLAKRTPNFWRQVIALDWSAALKNLRDFGDNYSTRRNKEADLLEDWISHQQ